MARKTSNTGWLDRALLLEIATRAARTFWQTFVANLTVGSVVATDLPALQAALIAAAAAALSVIWNATVAYRDSL